MVLLEFKQFHVIDPNGVRLAFDYKQQLIQIIRTVPPNDPQGVQKRAFNENDMDEAEALIAKLEASNGSVELTSAEVMHLAAKVGNAQWPFSDKAFKQFMVDIRGLQDQ